MKCNQGEEQLIDYLVNALEQEDKDRLEIHLTSCINCQQTLERLKKAWIVLAKWKPVIPNADLQHLRQEVVENVKVQKLIEEKSQKDSPVEALESEKSKVQTPRKKIGLAFIGRLLMNKKIVASAAVAVSIIFAVLGIDFMSKQNKAGVAWSSIIEKIEMIDSYRFQRRIKTTSAHKGTITRTMDVYHSSKYGNLLDQHWDTFGSLNIKIYVSFSDKTATVVHPRIKKYGRLVLPEEQVATIRNFDDPMYRVKEIMSFNYRKLGSKVIDSKKVEGIEVNDPRFEKGDFESCVGRLWVDVETNLPVLYETIAIAGDGKIPIELVQDSYAWDSGHDENIFKPDLSGYTLITEIVSQPANEETAVQMLRNFSEMTGGEYPYNLALFSCRTKINMIYRERMEEEIGFERAIYFWEEDHFEWEPFMRINNQIMQTCQFYGNLVKEDKDVAYYGKLVSPDDLDTPLMRWRIADDKYRVIFGDLRIEDVSEAHLAELEAALDKSQILHPPAPKF